MSFVIVGGCCNDASCVAVCPVNCIHPTPTEPDFLTANQLYIDAESCIECGICAEECPVEAIKPLHELLPSEQIFADLSADHYDSNPSTALGKGAVLTANTGSTKPPLPARIAVVGSGPAGCYAADGLSRVPGVSVTVIDRLPVPFGLVRYGISPDHQKTKGISRLFDKVLSKPNVDCWFNVEIGQDVTLDELRSHFDVVIWAGGLPGARTLSVPGVELPGSLTARQIVEWYNGHPDHVDSAVDLGEGDVVIVGTGNVALDVARMLVHSDEVLAATDVTAQAREALTQRHTPSITFVSRGGPERLACTPSELHALSQLPGVKLVISEADLERFDRFDPRLRIFRDALNLPPETVVTEIRFVFDRVPVAIEGDGRAQRIVLELPTGETDILECGLVVASIGYEGRPIDGLPFDEGTKTVANVEGRVAADGVPVVGLYCVGWSKRGAGGFIGTNRKDSEETVEKVLEDFASRVLSCSNKESFEDLKETVGNAIDYKGWRRIDNAERAAASDGAPRKKFVDIKEFLAAAKG